MNPWRTVLVPQKSHSSPGFFVHIAKVAQLVSAADFAAAISRRRELIRAELALRIAGNNN